MSKMILIEEAKVKQALEALEWFSTQRSGKAAWKHLGSIKPLRQAIAQAEKQEPVAYLCEPDEDGLYGLPTTDKACEKCFPVYRRPLANQTKREWVGLTPDEVLSIADQHPVEGFDPDIMAYTRAIEAKLKEKNHDL